MKKLIILIFIFAVQLSFAQNDVSYSKAVKEMLEASGSAATFKAVIPQYIELIKEGYPGSDPKMWKELEKEFTGTSLDELTEMLIPVYQRYLTEDDIHQLTAFYNSPVGKKFTQVSPNISTESMAVGAEWGRQIGYKLAEKIERKSK